MAKWWKNGGKRETFYLGLLITMLTTLITISCSFGEYKQRFNTVESAVQKHEECIGAIKSDIGEIKADVRVIKTYVTKELK